MKRLAGSLVLLGGLLRASSSPACQPPRYYIGAHAPAADEAASALNAPILMRFDTVSLDGQTFIDAQLESAYVKLIDPDTAGTISTTALRLSPNNGEAFAYLPDAPLKPNTKYHVISSLGPEWDFTTSDAPRAPLRLEGDLAVYYEVETERRYECTGLLGGCGQDDCHEIDPVNVTKAYLTLPAVFDGFADQHVQASIEVTVVGGPELPPAPQRVSVVAGKAGDGVITMPLNDDGKPYRACFSFEAMDARGDTVTSPQLCVKDDVPVPPMIPVEPEPEPEPDDEPTPWTEPGNPPIVVDEPDHPDTDIYGTPDDHGTPAAADDADRPRHSTSCSATGHASGSASGLAALALLGALSRRRRTRSAP